MKDSVGAAGAGLAGLVSKEWLLTKLAPPALVVMISFLCYGGNLFHGLVSDDLVLIPEQKAFHNPTDLRAIVGSLIWGDIHERQPIYRPLVTWSLAVNHRVNRALGLKGEHPAGFHLVNVLAHAMVACLVTHLLLKIGLPFLAGLSAGLLFAAHPIHTEAVSLVTNRSELLGAIFGVLFLLSHLRRRWYGGILIFLALLSKESAIVCLPLAIWLDFCPGVKRQATRLLPYIGPVFATMAWWVLRTVVVGDRSPVLFKSDNPLVDASFLERVATVGGIQLAYLRLQILPLGLSSDYSFDQIPVILSILDPMFLGFLLVSVLAFGVAWWFRKAHPFFLLSAVAYTILFSVTSNLVFLIGAPMAERWVYLPSIFFCGLAGYGVWMLREWKGKQTIALFGIVLGLCVIVTVDRNATWASQETYLQTQVRNAPNSARANHRLGRFYHDRGELAAAILNYRKALDILPNFPYAWNDLGGAYKDKGDLDRGRMYYEEALRYNPGLARAHYGLGQIHSLRGKIDQAVAAYRAATKWDTDYVEAYNNLATLFANSGRLELAEELWRRTLDIDPNYKIARDNLGKLEKIRAGLPGE